MTNRQAALKHRNASASMCLPVALVLFASVITLARDVCFEAAVGTSVSTRGSQPVDIELVGTFVIDFQERTGDAAPKALRGLVRDFLLEGVGPDDETALIVGAPGPWPAAVGQVWGTLGSFCMELSADVEIGDESHRRLLFDNAEFGDCFGSIGGDPSLPTFRAAFPLEPGGFTLSLVGRPCPTEVGSFFIRGDATSDGRVNIADVVMILSFLFESGREPDCDDAVDVNDDGDLAIDDALRLLGRLFLRDPWTAPPAPCWLDLTDDVLECNGPTACR